MSSIALFMTKYLIYRKQKSSMVIRLANKKEEGNEVELTRDRHLGS